MLGPQETSTKRLRQEYLRVKEFSVDVTNYDRRVALESLPFSFELHVMIF